MAQIAKGSEEYLGNGKMKVTRVSIFSNEERTRILMIYPEQFYAWKMGGRLIQEAMPHLTAAEREFLMTGASDEEWEKLAKADEDWEDEQGEPV